MAPTSAWTRASVSQRRLCRGAPAAPHPAGGCPVPCRETRGPLQSAALGQAPPFLASVRGVGGRVSRPPRARADDCVSTRLLRAPASLLPPADRGPRSLLSRVRGERWGEGLARFMLGISVPAAGAAGPCGRPRSQGQRPGARPHCMLLGPMVWVWAGAVASQAGNRLSPQVPHAVSVSAGQQVGALALLSDCLGV